MVTKARYVMELELKPIKGYERDYGINKEGKVWSFRSKMWIKRYSPQRSVCLYVRLHRDGKSKAIPIHRLLHESYPLEIEIRPLNGELGKRYGVTRDGRVWSYLMSRFMTTNHLNTHGYRDIHLYIDTGQRRRLRIHRLVAEAFIPNLNHLPVINHIDFDKLNNYYTNLEWCTPEYNARHQAKFLHNKTSNYLGVRISKRAKTIKWRAECKIAGHKHHIGCYSTEVGAAIAYNEFALINVPVDQRILNTIN